MQIFNSISSFEMHFSFENVAYAYDAVKKGYIDTEGVKIALSDNEKAMLKKAADEACELMDKRTILAAAEHNAHVMQQQAEAIQKALSEQMGLWELLFEDNDEDDEWVSPLKQLEGCTVSVHVEEINFLEAK